VLLARCDERKRDRDLDYREDRQPAPATAKPASTPAGQASASSTMPPSTTRAHARNAGGTPSSMATLMNKVGIPQGVETAENAT
jgi:hypothetical protein